MAAPVVLCFVPDLMDRSRISAACPDAQFVSAPADLAGRAATVIVLDVSRPGVLEVAPTLTGRVVGFAPHVDDDVIAAGRAAGIEVLPRSRFFAGLSALLVG